MARKGLFTHNHLFIFYFHHPLIYMYISLSLYSCVISNRLVKQNITQCEPVQPQIQTHGHYLLPFKPLLSKMNRQIICSNQSSYERHKTPRIIMWGSLWMPSQSWEGYSQGYSEPCIDSIHLYIHWKEKLDPEATLVQLRILVLFVKHHTMSCSCRCLIIGLIAKKVLQGYTCTVILHQGICISHHLRNLALSP